MTVLEACVDSTEAASLAVAAGADRVELCANLGEGGTTPSLGSIARAVADVGSDVMVMIRPRGGDFVYGRRELDIMERDIDVAQQAGAAGVVFGCLTQCSVSACEDRCAHEQRRREMDCVVAPQRLGLRELRCALAQFTGHLTR